MNFPPFDIKIATYTWKILFVDKKDRELEGDYGCCDYNKKAIFILSRLFILFINHLPYFSKVPYYRELYMISQDFFRLSKHKYIYLLNFG